MLEAIMTAGPLPVLKPVSIDSLRPTQISVGMREVKEKRRRLREYPENKKEEFPGRHMVPAIFGPKERYYITDHHHLALALHEEGAKHVLVRVVADLRVLERDAFWVFLDHRSWVYPYDADGVRQGYDSIPKSIEDLVDDPFRSLAGELRQAGGFAKDSTPFSEFLRADTLRRRMNRKSVDKDFDAALREALAFAKSQGAIYLPGWCGPSKDE
jgi:hypothetical protein